MLLSYTKKLFAGVEPEDDDDEDGSDFGC